MAGAVGIDKAGLASAAAKMATPGNQSQYECLSDAFSIHDLPPKKRSTEHSSGNSSNERDVELHSGESTNLARQVVMCKQAAAAQF